MAQIISMNDRIRSDVKTVWDITVDEDREPYICFHFIRSGEADEVRLLMVSIFCQDFDQITPLKNMADSHLKQHRMEILKGEPITVRPILKTRKEG